MAHKCVRCGRVYDGNSDILTKGCICGSKLFIYIPNEKLSEEDKKKLLETKKELLGEVKAEKSKKINKKEKEIEREIKELFNVKEDEVLVLPLEAVRIIGEGKFLIDVNKLFQEKLVVIKTKEGGYILQLY